MWTGAAAIALVSIISNVIHAFVAYKPSVFMCGLAEIEGPDPNLSSRLSWQGETETEKTERDGDLDADEIEEEEADEESRAVAEAKDLLAAPSRQIS